MIKIKTNTKAVNDVTTPLEGELRYIKDGLFLVVGDGRTEGGLQITTIEFGTAAPATTPSATGLLFLDTTGKKLYISTGTTNSSDWTILN